MVIHSGAEVGAAPVFNNLQSAVLLSANAKIRHRVKAAVDAGHGGTNHRAYRLNEIAGHGIAAQRPLSALFHVKTQLLLHLNLEGVVGLNEVANGLFGQAVVGAEDRKSVV